MIGPPPVTLASAQPFDIGPTLAAAQRAFRRHQRDAFQDVPGNVDLAGMRFQVVIRALPDDKGDFAQGNFKWKYKEGVLEFTLWRGDEKSPMQISATKRVGPSYRAQNGFGAQVRVFPQDWERSGLAWIGGLKSSDVESDGRFQASEQVSGPKARALSQAVVAVLEGTLSPLSGGQRVTACSSFDSDASVENPTQDQVVDCFAGASINRIAFVDERDRHVLAQWPAS